LVAHLTGGQGVAGSNPVVPTEEPQVSTTKGPAPIMVRGPLVTEWSLRPLQTRRRHRLTDPVVGAGRQGVRVDRRGHVHRGVAEHLGHDRQRHALVE
jgi:hypothetical protein